MGATRSATEQKFLDAALALFGEKGYTGTSVREICEHAGVTRPTLYYFFRNKEGVYRALVQGASRDVHRLIEQALDSTATLREQYRAVARAMFRDTRREPGLWRFIFGLMWQTPSVPAAQELFPHSYGYAMDLLTHALEAAVKRGELPRGNAELRVMAFVGALAEAISRFLILARPALTDKLADSLVDTVINGWQTEK